MRLRANFVDLIHTSVHGGQICIFCSAGCRNPVKHVISVCGHWSSMRQAIVEQLHSSVRSADKLVVAVLSATPSSEHFADTIQLCHAIDSAAAQFWKTKQNKTVSEL